MARLGRTFGNLIQRIGNSKIWQKIAGSAGFKFIQRVGPQLMLKFHKVRAGASQLWNVIGWTMLINDIKDFTEASACVYIALENEGDPTKMPSYCQDGLTKAYIKFALEMSGEGTTGNGYFTEEDEEAEQEGPKELGVTTTSTWRMLETPTPVSVTATSVVVALETGS
jgi:hypothetical protein